ncbi:hypothetical protein P4O66_011436 [Electrophorus voltai]|uniref:Tumor necrosis factor receptor superfamily member 6 n=1 Tax=Electrophorus voltai TaxID=2609070 RepID=A0AAD8Z927_9TELE|nr:hypothetical protein P4O66_011436 [Electrophorus voltai]
MMNSKRLGLLCFLVSVSLAWTVKGEGMRRRKRQQCAHGVYSHEAFQCCRCQTGHHVLDHCSTGQATQCAQCPDGTFMAHPNGEESCEHCTHCQHARHLEVKQNCTDKTNTVCRCLSGYYCDKGEDCFTCYSCEKCEGLGVKVACTATSNTVCHEKSSPGGLIACAVIIILVLVATVYVLWRMGCLKKCAMKKRNEDVAELEQLSVLSDDMVLRPYLSKIASVLKLQDVKAVARLTLDEAEIDRQEINHPNNAEEQTYKLLEAWYQKQGERGACKALVKALHNQGRKSDANRVQRIIQEGEEGKMLMS